MTNKKKIGAVIAIVGGAIALYSVYKMKKILSKTIVLAPNENTPMNQSTAEFQKKEDIQAAKKKALIGCGIALIGAGIIVFPKA